MKTFILTVAASVISIASGCASVSPQKLQQLEKTIQETDSGVFGQYMQQIYQANIHLEQAKTNFQAAADEQNEFLNDSVEYTRIGQQHADAALAARLKAEETYLMMQEPILADIELQKARLKPIQIFMAKRMELISEIDEEGESLRLEGVVFPDNSAVLSPASMAYLSEIASRLQELPMELRLEVAGYTSNTGDDAYNLRLSQERAVSVRDYLVSKGLAAGRLSAKGYGKANPQADNNTPLGRALNRRVEIHVTK